MDAYGCIATSPKMARITFANASRSVRRWWHGTVARSRVLRGGEAEDRAMEGILGSGKRGATWRLMSVKEG